MAEPTGFEGFGEFNAGFLASPPDAIPAEAVGPDFERDFQWAYANIGTAVTEEIAPNPSAWYLLEYARTAKVAFFKAYMDYSLKKRSEDARDVKWQDDKKKQMGFISTLADEYRVMSGEALTRMAQESPDVVLATLSGLGWSVHGPAESTGTEQPESVAGDGHGLVLPAHGPEGVGF
jgi:hypothetical protein